MRLLKTLILGVTIAGLLAPATAAAEPSYLDPAAQAVKDCRYATSGGPGVDEHFEVFWGDPAVPGSAEEMCLMWLEFANGRQLFLSGWQGELQCPELYEPGTNQYENCVDRLTRHYKLQLDKVDRETAQRVRRAAADCDRERAEMGDELFAQTYAFPGVPDYPPFRQCVGIKAFPAV